MHACASREGPTTSPEPARLAAYSVISLVQVVYGHLDDPESQDIKRGVSYLNLRPGASAWAATTARRSWPGFPVCCTAPAKKPALPVCAEHLCDLARAHCRQSCASDARLVEIIGARQ